MGLSQWYLILLILFFVVYLGYRALIFRKRFQFSPMMFLKSANPVEKRIWILLFFMTIPYAVLIVYHVLGGDLLMLWSFSQALFGLGVLVSVLGFLLMVFAHQQMGANWRMGVDEKRKIALVQEGLFGRSRNPVYLAVILISLGIFFVLQDFVSLLFLLVIMALFSKVISMEEVFLEKKFGKAYLAYKEKVRRLV
tara:strand:+ start:2462 stop:3046 length:585 start_codon:yes stop_codon:yes gene_type:complete